MLHSCKLLKCVTLSSIFLFLWLCYLVDSRNDGLAKTPPMGWLAWTKFMCQIDCVKHPKACISESLFVEMADRFVSDGYLDAGYDRINIDDCWMARSRNANGELVANERRFPHGIKWLVDYMHSRGIKLGIYTSIGKHTCMGFPGSVDFLERDAKTFISWNVDMLKLDGCFTEPKILDNGYPLMSSYLNGTNIVYSCSWPYYISTVAKVEPNHDLVKHHCHLWRNFDDIQISFASVARIIDYYDTRQDTFVPLHGPGSWNDPDMIIIGNSELSVGQAKVQMALWCIWSAPLLMSNDLRSVSPEHREILLNRRLIAVDQDRLGVMGRLILKSGSVNIYLKPVTPLSRSAEQNAPLTSICSFAVAFYNKDPRVKATIKLPLEKLGLHFKLGYDVQELFSGTDFGLLLPADILTVTIDPHSAVVYKATVKDGLSIIPAAESEKFSSIFETPNILSFWSCIRIALFGVLFACVLRRSMKYCRRRCRL